MTDHRKEYYKQLEKGSRFFEQGNVSGMIDTVFLMKMHLDQIPLKNPEADAMVFSNFAEICVDVLRAIFSNGSQAQRSMKKKIKKLDDWATQTNEKALTMYPLAVGAQINKVTWAANTLEQNAKSFGEVVREAGAQSGSYAKSYAFTGNLTASAVSKRRFKKELSKLLQMFTEYFSTIRSVDLYLEYGAFLVNLADFCEEMNQGDPEQILNIFLKVENKNLGFYDGIEESEKQDLIESFTKLQENATAKLAAL